MGLLDRFEQSVDRAVNGAFAKAFKADVQPVEIAAALQREMDDRAAIVSRGRTVVPNVFTVALADSDYERLSMYAEPLQTELAGMAREYAQEQRYTFLGPVEVTLHRNSELETGLFRVKSEAHAAAVAQPGGSAAHSGLGAAPRLLAGGGEYALRAGRTRLGRGTDVDIRIDDPGVSRHHAEIIIDKDIVVRDLGSTNGTFVDGVQINETPLRDGSIIRLGSTSLTFRSD